jgi:hypothetical protein
MSKIDKDPEFANLEIVEVKTTTKKRKTRASIKGQRKRKSLPRNLNSKTQNLEFIYSIIV